jgi:pyruvate,water dikinase
LKAQKKELVIWFDGLSKNDVPLVGGKNANLGEMINAELPVPPGFAVTAYSYEKFIKDTHIAEKIYEIINETVTDKNNPKQYDAASKKIRKLIEKSAVPEEIEDAVKSAYKELNKRLNLKDPFVAVRSSATAEDLPGASFAGQQETYLNVKGAKELIEKVVKCWSSLFTPRAIFYRNEQGFAHDKVFISVGVQKMVNSRAAGVMFTLNPVTGDTSEIVIEGNYGLGETVVSGAVNPDDFVVDKKTLKIKERRIARKTVQYIRDPKTGATVHLDVPEDKQKQPCITEKEILKLGKLAKRIEKHYGSAQDIEWAIDKDLSFPKDVFIVQSRPETVWSAKPMEKTSQVEERKPEEKLKVVVKGLAAGKRAYGVGVAKVVLSPDEAAEKMQKGDILVTDMTNPDFVPFMKIASAIVTDKGGITSHAAIVSRELAIPCVVGTETATEVMKTGKQYTVDARNGIIYEGLLPEATEAKTEAAGAVMVTADSAPVTATKIYMNLGVPEKIDDYKNLPFEGI